jgi:hypothetical protein
MGEFAKEKIKDLIKYLTYNEKVNGSKTNEKPEYEWSQNTSKEFIEIIGEPLLKYDLKELYLTKFYSEEEIDKEIERLNQLKNQISN